MPQDPWAEFRTGPAQQTPAQPQQAQPQPAYPGVIRGAPRQPDVVTPIQQAQESRAQVGQQVEIGNTAFDNVRAMASDFSSLPEVKNYSTVIRQLSSALSAAPNAAGDQSLIVSYARMLDPASVVREGEFDTTAQADNTFGQTVARLQREFGIEGGGRLSDEARRRVLQEMRNLAVNYRQGYEGRVSDYTERARRAGYDPRDVVGQDLGIPYNAAMRRYDQEHGIGRYSEQGGIQPVTNGGGDNPQFTDPQGPRPTLQDMYPEGAQLGMDQWGTTQPFDRIEYLRGIGIQPDAERQFVGIVNATARDKGPENFTREDMLQAYQQAGIQPGPDAAIDEVVAQINAGRAFAGFDTQAAEADYTRMLDQRLRNAGENPESIGSTVSSAASQGVTFGLADEAMGVGEGIAAAFRGQNPVTAYQVGRDTDRRIAQRSQAENPWTYGLTEFGSGLATGGVRAAPAVMRAEAPVAAAAREGAILGGVAGFGHGEGLQGSIAGTGVGAATGAAVGTGMATVAPYVGRAVNRVTEFARGNRPNASEVMPVVQAGERMGVPVRRADVDPAVRDTRAQVLQSPAGQQVRQTEADDLAAMEAALARELGGAGARDPYAVGGSIQRGVNRVIDAARARAGRLYDRAANRGQGITIQPNNALAEIDRNIAELTANGPTQNAAAINFLRGVRSDMQRDGGLSIGVMRAQRTNLRGNIEQAGLRATDMERRMTGILQAANSDIQAGLANNPEVAGLYSRADALWRQQAEFGQAIGRRLLGTPNQPVSPEQAAQRITAFIGGDFNRARDLIGQIDPATRSEIAAQVAANLGRKANGDFSLATFLTHTSEGRGRLIDERTVRLIFGDDGVRAINDLRILAQAKVAATERTNYSNTGGMVNRMGRGLRTMILGGIGMSEAGLTGGAVAVGASNVMQRLGEARAVRLLTNPDFTRWLRRLPETDNPRAIDGAFERLRSTAARNAQFQSDIQAFEQALIGAANDNTGMAVGVAAQPQDQQQR